jgi:HipA-like C-terminal domain
MTDDTRSSDISPPIQLPPISVPTNFRRNGRRGLVWELPRSFPGYFADTGKQVLGSAPKYVLRSAAPNTPEYLVKYPQKHGKRETYTEFFLNQLGTALGFRMAHSGLILLDGKSAFLTRIFTGPEESLRHGSLVIEDYYKDEKALERVRRHEEQAFYSIDFVVSLLREYCGIDFDNVFPGFIEMLIFDALIGSMDRHAQNWGIIGRISEPPDYHLAPIFDTARALLWSADENMLLKMSTDDRMLSAYIDRAKPCMGPVRTHPKVNNCNHFDFVENLLELYPHQTRHALAKIPDDIGERSARLLRRFPFRMGFSGFRKRLIVTILATRAERLRQILAKGGSHDRQTLAVPL